MSTIEFTFKVLETLPGPSLLVQYVPVDTSYKSKILKITIAATDLSDHELVKKKIQHAAPSVEWTEEKKAAEDGDYKTALLLLQGLTGTAATTAPVGPPVAPPKIPDVLETSISTYPVETSEEI